MMIFIYYLKIASAVARVLESTQNRCEKVLCM